MQVYTVHKKRVIAAAAFLFLGVFFLATAPVEQVPEDGRYQVTKLAGVVHVVSESALDPSPHSTVARDARKGTELHAGKVGYRHQHRREADLLLLDRAERRKPHRDTQSISEEEEDGEYGEYSSDDIVAEENEDNMDDEQDYEDFQDKKVFKDGDFDELRVEVSQRNATKTRNFTRQPRSPEDADISSRDFRTRSASVVSLRGTEARENATARGAQVLNTPRSVNVSFPRKGVAAKFKLPRLLPQKHGRRRRVTTTDRGGTPIVEDYVFWAQEVERTTPKGFTDEETGDILHRLRRLPVAEMESPTWNRCGRPKNQYLVFEDGSRACARYRAPHDYLVQGEVMSFYLSRLLGIPNVPVVALSSIGNGTQWRNPRVTKILQAAGWSSNATVALIQWIDNLERDKMPSLILESLWKKRTISRHTPGLVGLQREQLVEMLQWSDLILFDYITGNYDRVASMQDAADKEKRPAILQETIHNLVKSRTTRGIWLIDNESGLLDSYSLLYSRPSRGGGDQDVRFMAFHRAMLRTICIFRRLTVERVSWLCGREGAHRVLTDFISSHEPLFGLMPDVAKSKEFSEHFQMRICEVDSHVQWCKRHARTL